MSDNNETYKEMLGRHIGEIEVLQRECVHEDISDWMPHYWAPGHSSHYEVKVCQGCGKVVETNKPEMQIIRTPSGVWR